LTNTGFAELFAVHGPIIPDFGFVVDVLLQRLYLMLCGFSSGLLARPPLSTDAYVPKHLKGRALEITWSFDSVGETIRLSSPLLMN
jgi:hypothetical protein